MSTQRAEEHTPAGEDSEFVERRAGPVDRRMALEDRRNLERVSQEIAPRRHPDIKDRRKRR